MRISESEGILMSPVLYHVTVIVLLLHPPSLLFPLCPLAQLVVQKAVTVASKKSFGSTDAVLAGK